jgi:hypothetical protein
MVTILPRWYSKLETPSVVPIGIVCEIVGLPRSVMKLIKADVHLPAKNDTMRRRHIVPGRFSDTAI